jgi:haloacetate dehalogenase
VVAVMAALGHDRFAVVGHDRGGRVAYRTALDHPDRVDRLCTLDIIPTIEQFELLASSRRAAVGGFHWYFLAVPPPLPEALIGAEPQLYLEQVMGRWAGRREGAESITAEAMAAYLRDFTPAVIAASCADYRAGATFDSELDAADRDVGRTIGCPVHALWGDRRDRRRPRHVATVDGGRSTGDRASVAVRTLHPRGASGPVPRGAAGVPRLTDATRRTGTGP